MALDNEVNKVVQNLDQVSSSADKATSQVDKLDSSTKKATTDFSKLGSSMNSALGILSKSLEESNPQLSTLFSSTQKLIPNIVEIGNAAQKSGSLLKAMTSASGIGALINLVITLVTNFDNITKALGFSSEAIEDFKSRAISTFKNILTTLSGVGNSILQYILTPIRTSIEAFKGLGSIIKDVFTGNFSQIKEHASQAAQGIKDAFTKGFNFKESFSQGKEWADSTISGFVSRFSSASSEAKSQGQSFGKSLGDGISEGIDESDIQSKLDKLMSLSASYVKQESLKNIAEGLKLINEQLENETDPARIQQLQEVSNELLKQKEILETGIDQEAIDAKNQALIQSWEQSLLSEQEKLDLKYEQLKQAGANELELEEWYQSEKTRIVEEQEAKRLQAEQQAQQESIKLQQEKIKSFENIALAANYVSQAISSITSAYTASVQQQVKDGKISDQEGKKRIKAMMILQAGVTLMNGLAASIAAWAKAFSPDSGMPFPVALAAAIATSAAVIAQTVAAVSQIRSVDSGSTATPSVSSSAPSALQGTTQVYSVTRGEDTDAIVDAIKENTTESANSKVVLVVEDLNQVQDNMKQTEVESSYT